LIAIKEVFASLYNDRAIAYRVHQGFAHDIVAFLLVYNVWFVQKLVLRV
jgi:phosphoenolpyruvate synthase/pyruvate phosphate dikinase